MSHLFYFYFALICWSLTRACRRLSDATSDENSFPVPGHARQRMWARLTPNHVSTCIYFLFPTYGFAEPRSLLLQAVGKATGLYYQGHANDG
jgi:hypothetical protein